MENGEVKLVFVAPTQADRVSRGLPNTFETYACNIPRVGEMVSLPDFFTGRVKDVQYVYSRFGGWDKVVIDFAW